MTRRPSITLYDATYITVALVVFLISLVAIIVWSARPAGAHDAPTGWTYDYSCCSTADCREVQTKAVKEDSRGFTIVSTGELIPYGDTRIKRSKDEFFHWCSVAGLDDSRSLCLYVPDRGI